MYTYSQFSALAITHHTHTGYIQIWETRVINDVVVYMCHGTLVGGLLKIFIIVLLHLTHQQEFDAQFTSAVCKINHVNTWSFLIGRKKRKRRRTARHKLSNKPQDFQVFSGHLWVSTTTPFLNGSQFLICNMLRTMNYYPMDPL